MSLGIRQWIQQAAGESVCRFRKYNVDGDNPFDFYEAEHEHYDRFLVVGDVKQLPKPNEINQAVIDATPDDLISLPTFAKNTDLILLYKRNDLHLTKSDEASLYAIEEDSYSFKKQVLYYTNKEMELINSEIRNHNQSWIHNREEFVRYRNNPEIESGFNLLIRLYIKLPFLAVPVAHDSMLDIAELANEMLQEQGLLELSKKTGMYFSEIEDIEQGNEKTLEQLVEELINERMETQSNQD